MKKYMTKGEIIKNLRCQLPEGALQKEMAYRIGIGIRTLRSIENGNKPVTLAELDRIAAYLSVPRDYIAFSVDGPKLVFPSSELMEKLAGDWSRDRLVARFDEDFASVTMDEAKLFQEASTSHDIAIERVMLLNDELDRYVDELTAVLAGLTWNASPRKLLTEADELAMKADIRRLLVLLRGNDVWTYQTNHFRTLPERDDLPPEDEPSRLTSRLVLAFAPPGDYGEDSVSVQIDHGQPFILKAWNPDKQWGA